MPLATLKSRIGLGLCLFVFVAAIGALALRIDLATTPTRPPAPNFDLAEVLGRVERVHFTASDGTGLAGWWANGRKGRSPIVLCHDLGSRKEELVDLGLTLAREGFPVLWFDFRGHGESEGRGSTLGLAEKRDVLGALDFAAARLGPSAREIGVYAVGMGAHAAVLAAADRPAVRVLVLEDVYPDAAFSLASRVWGGWAVGERYLSFASEGLFCLVKRVRIADQRAADVLARMVGRDVLLLAPASDPRLATEMERMYDSIPLQRERDGNLVVLPATQGDGLYGEEADRHRDRVVEFLRQRLDRPD